MTFSVIAWYSMIASFRLWSTGYLAFYIILLILLSCQNIRRWSLLAIKLHEEPEIQSPFGYRHYSHRKQKKPRIAQIARITLKLRSIQIRYFHLTERSHQVDIFLFIRVIRMIRGSFFSLWNVINTSNCIITTKSTKMGTNRNFSRLVE